jgi:hypothetical protein
MSTKPILFNTEMVRAILDGRKSCIRRICKDANECTVPDMDYYDPDKRTYAVHNYADKKHTDKLSIAERTCPICPGDILYVRETWHKGLERYIYRANYSDTEKFYRDGKEIEMKWHPSIHMPKEAARIWLKVTDVRVEQLQDITSKQICKEGIEVEEPYVLNGEEKRYAFSRLWDSTVKKSDLDRYGWNANPWVWVIEFERCERGGIDG